MKIYYSSIIFLPNCFARRGFAHIGHFHEADRIAGFHRSDCLGQAADHRTAGCIVLAAHSNWALAVPGRGWAGSSPVHYFHLRIMGLN